MTAVAAITYVSDPHRQAVNQALKNQTELERVAKQCLEGKHDIEMAGVRSIRVQEGEYPMVEFYTGGFGIAPSSIYYGFYYSPEDVPLAAFNEEYPLYQVAESAWQWQGMGDNGGYTEKITDCWYYFKVWF